MPAKACSGSTPRCRPSFDEPVQGRPTSTGKMQRAARFAAAMNDDFNTVIAVSVLFELAGRTQSLARARDELLLRQLAAVLGLLGQTQDAVRRSGLRGAEAVEAGGGAPDDQVIEQKIANRAAAKKARQYAEADAIRAALAEVGIVLEDGAGGTTWRRR